jgi:fumarylacetoacetate (FAA) hydrolase family protein
MLSPHFDERTLTMTLSTAQTPSACLPLDRDRATLLGRLWLPEVGPCIVGVRGDDVVDLSALGPTTAHWFDLDDPAAAVRRALPSAPRLASLAEVLANGDEAARDPARPWLLAPCDVQVIKASGVTFVESLLERVIEEQARGDLSKAAGIRAALNEVMGDNLKGLVPGSPEAARVKQVLIEQGAWSQYLEVGIGPDAELFTKSPVLSAVGTGAQIGIHPASVWNNPEPEIVLVVNSRGHTVGATLGNDVNLRDFEGRSALLLGRSKDNNASCAIGPFVRLFDADFGIDDVRRCDLALTVQGAEGFRLEGSSAMSKISRDPLDLVAQAISPQHQYPDGLVLFLGTMFAPIQDRHGPGQGFTHEQGDLVAISTARLGTLLNRVTTSDRAAPWTFGIGALMRNLAARGLLRP